jgi:Na+-transporting NADH:ubiquinone oxidoreductase subunit C
MNTNSNLYTFIYASVMVIIVAAVLSFTAIKLQPIQEENVKIEKMQDILTSVHVESTVENAKKNFEKYITKTLVINASGDEISGIDAFSINLKQQYDKKPADRNLPVYLASLDDGSVKVIFPLRGTGLWGPIWGYLALNDDMNTIYGAVFDHAKETPGLGADINKDWFEKPFEGKKIFEGSQLVGINVYKGGKGAAMANGDIDHGVDGISGGTITSNALDDMVLNCLSSYEKYLIKNKK